MKLRLAPDLALPLEAVTETFGILAARGAGKSNTAAVMAEEMFTAKLPFVVVDPVRAWWGLRSSRDGTGPGLPMPQKGGLDISRARQDLGYAPQVSLETGLSRCVEAARAGRSHHPLSPSRPGPT